MKVGVVIPVRDGLPYIETCLTSINEQTYPCAAYVVDDGSVDGTYEFLQDRPSWWRFLDRHEDSLGWPWSLNNAASNAIEDGCDAVFVMNADDFLRLDCIEKCVRLLHRVDAVVPYTQQIGGENVVQESAAHVTLNDFISHTPMVAFGLVRSSVWEALNGYHQDVNLPGMTAGYNEWDFWLRFHKAGYLHAVVTDPVVYYRMHHEQLHKETTSRHEEAVSLIYKKHPELHEVLRRAAS